MVYNAPSSPLFSFYTAANDEPLGSVAAIHPLSPGLVGTTDQVAQQAFLSQSQQDLLSSSSSSSSTANSFQAVLNGILPMSGEQPATHSLLHSMGQPPATSSSCAASSSAAAPDLAVLQKEVDSLLSLPPASPPRAVASSSLTALPFSLDSSGPYQTGSALPSSSSVSPSWPLTFPPPPAPPPHLAPSASYTGSGASSSSVDLTTSSTLSHAPFLLPPVDRNAAVQLPQVHKNITDLRQQLQQQLQKVQETLSKLRGQLTQAQNQTQTIQASQGAISPAQLASEEILAQLQKFDEYYEGSRAKISLPLLPLTNMRRPDSSSSSATGQIMSSSSASSSSSPTSRSRRKTPHVKLIKAKTFVESFIAGHPLEEPNQKKLVTLTRAIWRCAEAAQSKPLITAAEKRDHLTLLYEKPDCLVLIIKKFKSPKFQANEDFVEMSLDECIPHLENAKLIIKLMLARKESQEPASPQRKRKAFSIESDRPPKRTNPPHGST